MVSFLGVAHPSWLATGKLAGLSCSGGTNRSGYFLDFSFD